MVTRCGVCAEMVNVRVQSQIVADAIAQAPMENTDDILADAAC